MASGVAVVEGRARRRGAQTLVGTIRGIFCGFPFREIFTGSQPEYCAPSYGVGSSFSEPESLLPAFDQNCALRDTSERSQWENLFPGFSLIQDARSGFCTLGGVFVDRISDLRHWHPVRLWPVDRFCAYRVTLEPLHMQRYPTAMIRAYPVGTGALALSGTTNCRARRVHRFGAAPARQSRSLPFDRYRRGGRVLGLGAH